MFFGAVWNGILSRDSLVINSSHFQRHIRAVIEPEKDCGHIHMSVGNYILYTLKIIGCFLPWLADLQISHITYHTQFKSWTLLTALYLNGAITTATTWHLQFKRWAVNAPISNASESIRGQHTKRFPQSLLAFSYFLNQALDHHNLWLIENAGESI